MDPGPVSTNPPPGIHFRFSTLNGTAVSGQSVALDFLFSDSKRIVVFDRNSSIGIILETNWPSGVFHPTHFLPGTAYLGGTQISARSSRSEKHRIFHNGSNNLLIRVVPNVEEAMKVFAAPLSDRVISWKTMADKVVVID